MHVSFCVVVLIITTVLVYHWGREMARRRAAPALHRATAQVIAEGLPREADSLSDFLGRDVRGELLSSLEPGEDVSIEMDARPTSAEMQFTVVGEDTQGDAARDRVRGVAERAVELMRKALAGHRSTLRRQREQRTERARAEMDAAQAAYEDYFHNVYLALPSERPNAKPSAKDGADGSRAMAGAVEQKDNDAQGNSPPDRRVNPAWADLNERLATARAQRKELLIDRTPNHPAVAEAEANVAELSRRLAGMRRWLPVDEGEHHRRSFHPNASPTHASPNHSSPPRDEGPLLGMPTTRPSHSETDRSAPSTGIAASRSTARAKLEAMRAELKQAEQAYMTCLQLERADAAAEDRAPRFEILVHEPECLVAAVEPRESLWGTALTAGLAMAVGLGFFSAGAAMEPVVNSRRQLDAVLGGETLLGAVPAPITIPPPARRGGGVLVRATLCLAGVLLMTACGAIVWWTLFR